MHVISPRLFSMMTEEGAFPIFKTYLRLAKQGEKILAFRGDEYYWRDLGTPEHVRQAEAEIALEHDALVMRKPESNSRHGWAEASRRIVKAGDDKLIWPECENQEDGDLQW